MLGLLVIGQASAVTISETIRYNSSLSVGAKDSFVMVLSPSAGEKTITFEQISTDGNCASWLSLNRTSVTFDKRIGVKADITVPRDNVTNGNYRCNISFITPVSGAIQSVMQVPVVIRVTGGTEPTVEPTPVPTELPTIVATTELPTPVPTTAKPTPKVTYTPLPIWVSLAGLGAVASLFVIKRKKE